MNDEFRTGAPSPQSTRVPRFPGDRKAFTILELLVAMTVFALLILLVAQIIGMSSNAVTGSSKKMDSVAAARFALDRLGMDLSVRLNRDDVGIRLTKAAGNDSLAFYSALDGYTGTRRLAAVGYQVGESPDDGQNHLQRGVTGRNWEDDFPGASPVIGANDYEILSENVLRLEMSFLTTDGQVVSSGVPDLNTIAALIVAVACLDPASRQILKSGETAVLAAALPDPVDGEKPLKAWQNALAQPEFAAGIYPGAVQNLRFFQRTFYVR